MDIIFVLTALFAIFTLANAGEYQYIEIYFNNKSTLRLGTANGELVYGKWCRDDFTGIGPPVHSNVPDQRSRMKTSGRKWSPSGTKGSFEIIDKWYKPNSVIAKVSWDYPWGAGKKWFKVENLDYSKKAFVKCHARPDDDIFKQQEVICEDEF